jgi:ABC-type multidrug transport system ATPase subunit
MGISIFVSSHLLGEIEKICDRVAIVHRGRTLTEGRVAELVGQSGESLEELFLKITSGETVGL